MINKNFLYAVVGTSNNKEKYGYKVFKDLLNAGYKVLPINPNEKGIL
jgi:predicted CoA-binding protein